MWSWTDCLAYKAPDFASYDHRIRVFHVFESPLGDVLVKQTHCPDSQDLQYEVQEYRKVEGVLHPWLVECLDWREERQPDGSGYLYEIYPKQGPTIELDIRKRCMADTPGYYPEEYLWQTLKQFIDMHALLQSKGFAHHDIKSANIFRQPDNTFRVINWGFGSEADIGRNLSCMLPFVSPLLRRAFILGERDLRQAGDIRAKSNVYSLGVLMMFLTFLDLPMFVTNLKDLQFNIEKRLKGVEHYSKSWVKALRRLLTVDEPDRPDFLQLLDEINRPLIPFMSASISTESFLDDEPIVLPKATFTSPFSPLHITITCGTPYLRVDSSQPDGEIPCVLRLEANSDNRKRPGLDVICVVDVGKGEELKVIKAGLERVLLKLGEGDRMAIIGYANTGRKFAKLTICSKAGKVALRDVIMGIRPDIGANLVAGLVCALQAVTQCRTRNSLTSIFLFGNGAGLWQDEAIHTCVEVLKTVNVDQCLSLHCFAPGTEYNFPLLFAVTQEACGCLHLVPSEETMRTAVEQTLASLDSVVAREIKVTASNDTVSQHCTVGSYLCAKGTLPLQLPYLVAGQCFELVFMLAPTAKVLERPMKRPTYRFDIQYKGNNDEDISISEHLYIWLLPLADTPEPKKEPQVYTSYHRRKIALCLFEVLNQVCEGKLQTARERVKECLEMVKQGKEREDLLWTQKAVEMEKWNREEWATVISLAAKYYYYGEKEELGTHGKDRVASPVLSPTSQQVLSPLAEVKATSKVESPTAPPDAKPVSPVPPPSTDAKPALNTASKAASPTSEKPITPTSPEVQKPISPVIIRAKRKLSSYPHSEKKPDIPPKRSKVIR